MTEGERMSVCEQPNRREKVGRIITLLRGKGDWDLDIFMNLLRKSGNEVWAGQLEEKVWLIKTDPQGGGRSTSLNRWNVCTMFAHIVWELSVGGVRYAGTSAILNNVLTHCLPQPFQYIVCACAYVCVCVCNSVVMSRVT